MKANRVARWDFKYGWTPLGSGVDGHFPITSLGICFHIPNFTGKALLVARCAVSAFNELHMW